MFSINDAISFMVTSIKYSLVSPRTSRHPLLWYRKNKASVPRRYPDPSRRRNNVSAVQSISVVVIAQRRRLPVPDTSPLIAEYLSPYYIVVVPFWV